MSELQELEMAADKAWVAWVAAGDAWRAASDAARAWAEAAVGVGRGGETVKSVVIKMELTQIQTRHPDGSGAPCIGFNESEQKWYGWSHRAIYGFGIGSTCEKGDCHYVPDKGSWTATTLDEAKQMAINFAEDVA